MAPTFCPQCNEPLSRTRGATPLVCPICATVIAPEPAGVTAALPSPAEGRGNGPKRPPVEFSLRVIQPLGRAWRTVYFGLGVLKWGTVAALAALAFNIIAVLGAASHRPEAAGAGLPAEDRLGALAVIIPSALAVVLSLLGGLCCCWAPAESGARLPAALAFLGTLLAQLLAAFAVLQTMLVELGSASPVWVLPAVLAAGVVSLAAEALFLVCLYQVGRFLPAPEVGRRVLGVAVATVIVVVGVFLLVLGVVTSQPAPPSVGSLPPALVVSLAGMCGAALVLLLYFDLINVTRRALARRFAGEAARGAGAWDRPR
jgi:LSD1 subclass zinc finger protein